MDAAAGANSGSSISRSATKSDTRVVDRALPHRPTDEIAVEG